LFEISKLLFIYFKQNNTFSLFKLTNQYIISKMADDKKEIQAEAVAEVVEVNSGAPAASDEKQGSKCCKLRAMRFVWFWLWFGRFVMVMVVIVVLSFSNSNSLFSPSRFAHRVLFVSRILLSHTN